MFRVFFMQQMYVLLWCLIWMERKEPYAFVGVWSVNIIMNVWTSILILMASQPEKFLANFSRSLMAKNILGSKLRGLFQQRSANLCFTHDLWNHLCHHSGPVDKFSPSFASRFLLPKQTSGSFLPMPTFHLFRCLPCKVYFIITFSGIHCFYRMT